MSEQTQMRFDWVDWQPVTQPENAGETIDEQFQAFHRANPHIYRILRALAMDYRRAGHDHCGIKMLYEVLRYQSGIYTRGDAYKLNNNYTSRYARLLMKQEPELAGFFETRELAETAE